MYTQCPACQTIFRVSDAQLGVAAGKVRCGQCLSIFAAPEHRLEAPPADTAPPPPGDDRQPPAQPQPPEVGAPEAGQAPLGPEEQISRLLSDAGRQSPPEQPTPAQSRKPSAPQPQQRGDGGGDRSENPPFLTEQADESPAQPDPGRRERPGPQVGAGDAVVTEAPPREEEFEAENGGSVPLDFAAAQEPDTGATADEPLPAALRQPKRRGAGPLAVLFWSVASLLMVALLGLQYAYYERYELAANPAARPWLERMCGYLDCHLPPRRETAAFSLRERDVRYHPKYEGALLITGTFLNGAPFPQPYPEVEVLLKNVNGEVVASRQFTPDEYLRSPAAAQELLPAETEARLVLEVSDPGNQAVSFEFNFH